MKTISILVLLLLVSCSSKSHRKYKVFKSEDNNWTTTAEIEVDSFDFVTENHVIIYVDGRKTNLKGGLIKVYDNQ